MKKKKIKKTTSLSNSQIKAKVRDFVFAVDWFFDCAYWTRDIIWSSTPHAEEADCNADVTVDEKYQTVSIRIYPKFFDMSLEDQVETLVHELVHILLQPSKLVAFDLLRGDLVTEKRLLEVNEKATSQITARLIALMENRSSYVKKAYNKYIYGKK